MTALQIQTDRQAGRQPAAAMGCDAAGVHARQPPSILKAERQVDCDARLLTCPYYAAAFVLWSKNPSYLLKNTPNVAWHALAETVSRLADKPTHTAMAMAQWLMAYDPWLARGPRVLQSSKKLKLNIAGHDHALCPPPPLPCSPLTSQPSLNHPASPRQGP